MGCAVFSNGDGEERPSDPLLRAVALPLGCCPGELGISYQGLASRDKACAFLPNLCRREATDSLRYLRSDCPVDLKEGELEQFRQWRVTTVIDLRSAEEIARKPYAFAGREGFYYHSLPLAGGGLPDTEDDVAVFYFDMVEPGERMKQVMKTIAAAPGGASSTARRERTAPASPRLCSSPWREWRRRILWRIIRYPTPISSR